MAWFSFHGGHSGQFCRHAHGTLRQVIESAVARGFSSYGVSEHGPKARVEDLFAEEADLGVAGSQEFFRSYAQLALALQEELSDRIDLLVGFETEVVPPDDGAAFMREVRSWAPFDYVVGSVHHAAGQPFDYSLEHFDAAVEAAGGRDALDAAYFDQVAELVSALEPEVVGHFDLIRIGDGARGREPRFAESTWSRIDAALHAVREAGSLLEVNAAPVRKEHGPVYPLPAILERARRMGIPVTLGDDSHGPDQVGLGLLACVRAVEAAGYDAVHQLLRRDGLAVAEPVPLSEVAPGAGSSDR